MKRVLLVLAMCLPMMLTAQQKVAVYVTSDSEGVDDATKEIIGGELVAAIVNTNKYKAVERTADFLQQISKEQSYQHSGEVDIDQISAIGKQFGVNYVCVASIMTYKNSYYIQARLIDVETATVQGIARETSSLANIDEIISASSKVANALINPDGKQKSRSAKPTSNKEAKTFYAATLNYSFTNNKFSLNKFNTSNDVWSGLNVGFLMQQKLYKRLVLISGLQYQFTQVSDDDYTNGWSKDEAVYDAFNPYPYPYPVGSSETHPMIYRTYSNHNIIIPIKLGFSMPFGKKSSFSVYAGLSLNFTVSTQSKIRTSQNWSVRTGTGSSAYYTNYSYNLKAVYDYVLGNYDKEITDIKNVPEATDEEGYHYGRNINELKVLNWFDIPIGFGAFYSISHFGFRCEYEFGIINRYRDVSKGKFYSDLFTVGMYYYF